MHKKATPERPKRSTKEASDVVEPKQGVDWIIDKPLQDKL